MIFAASPTTSVVAVFGALTVIDRCEIEKFVLDVSRTDECVVPLTRILVEAPVGAETRHLYEPLLAMFVAIDVHVADG